MKIEQIYTGCLAQGAYYIVSEGEAAIIDPLREVEPYIKRMKKDGVTLKYIFETHFHADFVSGHVTLSEKTGAPIIYGPTAEPSFDAIIAKDGQEFKLGNTTIKAIHTPGHTMESTSYILQDESGVEKALFSGDTLFLGDVGRPDLAQKATDMTQEDLAGLLFESLRTKIMPLSDELIVYPAHGAGSACGKNMMKETMDTLGNQKKVNYALRSDMTKDEFIKEVTDGLLPPPAYFPLNVKLNKEGYQDSEEVLKEGFKALSPKEFELIAEFNDALVIDARPSHEFAKGFIPRSININLDGTFAPWVGALVKDVKTPILLVVSKERAEEAITRLSRVGFDHTLGYLEGGIDAWIADDREIDKVDRVAATELSEKYQKDLAVFDVRRPTEYSSEHVENAHSTPLSDLNEHLSEFPSREKFYVYCASGNRSMTAASILKARGIHNILEVEGGIAALKETGIQMTDYVCPTTL